MQLFLELLCAFALSPTLPGVSTNNVIFYVSVWPKPWRTYFVFQAGQISR